MAGAYRDSLKRSDHTSEHTPSCRYRASARELQRLNSISKSPIYSAFNEALSGAASIQAFGAVERFCRLQSERFDYNLRAAFASEAVAIWLQVVLQAMSSVVIGGAALFCVVTSGEGSRGKAALAGLALTYAPQLTDNINYVLQAGLLTMSSC